MALTFASFYSGLLRTVSAGDNFKGHRMPSGISGPMWVSVGGAGARGGVVERWEGLGVGGVVWCGGVVWWGVVG